MQRGRGRSHSSQPYGSQRFNGSGNANNQLYTDLHSQSTDIGALAAHALVSTLANSYDSRALNYPAYPQHAQLTRTTPQGYTLSSTYVANPQNFYPQIPSTSLPPTQLPRNNRVTRPSSSQANNRSFSSPGDTRCTYTGCLFTGSKHTVEIHMMDRHLIFPPGWRKRQTDWDADPSLKGKPVPIQGTGLTLNTPEDIDAWLAERKKRWPSKQRVEEKSRKKQEAMDRGEIEPSELTRPHKRHRVDGPSQNKGRGRADGRNRHASRGGGISRRPDSGWPQKRSEGGVVKTTPNWTNTNQTRASDHHENHPSPSSRGDTSDSNSDMDPVKDAVSSKAPILDTGDRMVDENSSGAIPQTTSEDYSHETAALGPSRRPLLRQQVPRPRVSPASNPFAARPSLLRRLLLPEIRNTVSNLSQAIHFLVENDFLEGVELTPGESDSQRIKVLGTSDVTLS